MAAEELTTESEKVDTPDESKIMSMRDAPPVPPPPKHHRGHKAKELPPTSVQSEPLPVEAEAEGTHHKKEGKHKHGVAGNHTKELDHDGPKLG